MAVASSSRVVESRPSATAAAARGTQHAARSTQHATREQQHRRQRCACACGGRSSSSSSAQHRSAAVGEPSAARHTTHDRSLCSYPDLMLSSITRTGPHAGLAEHSSSRSRSPRPRCGAYSSSELSSSSSPRPLLRPWPPRWAPRLLPWPRVLPMAAVVVGGALASCGAKLDGDLLAVQACCSAGNVSGGQQVFVEIEEGAWALLLPVKGQRGCIGGKRFRRSPRSKSATRRRSARSVRMPAQQALKSSSLARRTTCQSQFQEKCFA